MTRDSRDGAHLVCVLVTDGVGLAELGQAGDVFRAAARAPGVRASRYQVVVATPARRSVRTKEGYDLQVSNGLDALTGAGTVVLPGCQPVDTIPEPQVLTAVRSAHRAGARVAATCTGVSVAAAAGLLDGRTATTHWSHADAFSRAYPKVVLAPDVLYVDHGDVVTGAGTSAGLDVYLHLVRTDHGPDVAAAARHLIAPRQREGTGPQLPTDPVLATPRIRPDPLSLLLEHLATHLHEPQAVPAAAARLGLSERTLRRRFADRLGTTPGRWVATERLRQAQHLLETTDLPVETVAHRLGLASATVLRRQFRRELDTTPREHRAVARGIPEVSLRGPSTG